MLLVDISIDLKNFRRPVIEAANSIKPIIRDVFLPRNNIATREVIELGEHGDEGKKVLI